MSERQPGVCHHLNRILELREILLSSQTGFNLVNAAVVCAILQSISGLEPSSVIAQPRYLKLVIVSSFSPFTLNSLLMPLMLFVINLVFSALMSIPEAVEALSKRLTYFVCVFYINSLGTNHSPFRKEGFPSNRRDPEVSCCAMPQALCVDCFFSL